MMSRRSCAHNFSIASSGMRVLRVGPLKDETHFSIAPPPAKFLQRSPPSFRPESTTMPDIDGERTAVVAEARAWLRTPYHHMGRVKGAGVDCATLLAEVYARAGVIPPVAIPFYPPDWHLHRDAERYLGFVLDYAVELSAVSSQLSADVQKLRADSRELTAPLP